MEENESLKQHINGAFREHFQRLFSELEADKAKNAKVWVMQTKIGENDSFHTNFDFGFHSLDYFKGYFLQTFSENDPISRRIYNTKTHDALSEQTLSNMKDV